MHQADTAFALHWAYTGLETTSHPDSPAGDNFAGGKCAVASVNAAARSQFSGSTLVSRGGSIPVSAKALDACVLLSHYNLRAKPTDGRIIQAKLAKASLLDP